MRIKRVLILAGLVAGVIALCVTGLAAATPGHPPLIPPPYPQMLAESVITSTSFYAWQQNNYSSSLNCQGYWGHGWTCLPGAGSLYDMAFELTATVTTPGGSVVPATFNQLAPLPSRDDYSIPSTYFNSSSWATAADDFVITTTPGVTVTITDIRVLGAGLTASDLLGRTVRVCFFNDNGGLAPIGLPGTMPLGSTCQNLTPLPTSIVPGGSDATHDQYFSVQLATPQVFTSTAPASVGRKWLTVQINALSITDNWFWYNAISPFSWPYSLSLPYVHK